MVSVPIGGVRVDLQLNSAAFIRDIAKSTSAVSTNTKRMAASFDAVNKSVGALSLGFGALFSERAIKKLINYNTEAIKLAATFSGPLGDASRKYFEESKKFTETFQLGVAQGFFDSLGVGISNTADGLEAAAGAGRIFGQVMGGILVAVVNFLERINQRIEILKTKLRDLVTLALDPRLGITGVPGGGQPGFRGAGRGAPAAAPTAALPAFQEVHDEIGGNGVKSWLAYGESITAANKALTDTTKNIEVAFPDIEKLQREQFEASIKTTQQWIGVADTVGQALGTMFKENKAVAIAQAVINTAQAITEAMKLPFPINWAQIAAVSALGAAQIATIVSTQPGSSSKVTKTAGGGGAAAAGSASTASRSRAAPTQTVSINIVGDIFGPEHFRKIVSGINGVQKDGTALLRIA